MTGFTQQTSDPRAFLWGSGDAEDAVVAPGRQAGRGKDGRAGARVLDPGQQQRRADDVGDPPGGYGAAAVDDGHLVARLLDLAQLVAGHEHGPAFGGQLPEQQADLADT